MKRDSSSDEKLDRFSLNQISDRVKFNIEQTARICSVTRRQLSYWTKKGIISGEKGYNLASVEKALLIKKHLEAGNTLRQSVAHTELLLMERQDQRSNLESLSGDRVKEALTQRLDMLEQEIAKIRRALPLHTTVARLNRVWNVLAELNLESIFNHPAQAQPIHETLTRLDEAIDKVEALVKDLNDASR
ncbi:MAG: MerR family transcriptional regulator [Dehalococcoidia bacterium]|nr:MerR family transcriptional regulator [Dehalococcoidia bacterium]